MSEKPNKFIRYKKHYEWLESDKILIAIIHEAPVIIEEAIKDTLLLYLDWNIKNIFRKVVLLNVAYSNDFTETWIKIISYKIIKFLEEKYRYKYFKEHSTFKHKLRDLIGNKIKFRDIKLDEVLINITENDFLEAIPLGWIAIINEGGVFNELGNLFKSLNKLKGPPCNFDEAKETIDKYYHQHAFTRTYNEENETYICPAKKVVWTIAFYFLLSKNLLTITKNWESFNQFSFINYKNAHPRPFTHQEIWDNYKEILNTFQEG